MTDTAKLALTARFARVLAFATLTAAIFGPLLARFGLVTPMRGFLLFALALPFAVAAILFGLLGLISTRKATGKLGARSSWFALVVGFGALLLIGSLGRAGSDAPAIHDITTNLDSPPEFVELTKAEANQGVDLTFPHGPEDTVELHQGAYGDLQTMHLMRTPADVLAQAQQVAADLGWTVVGSQGPTPVGPAPQPPADSESAGEPEGESTGDGEANESTTEDGEEPAPVDLPPQPVEAQLEATDTSGIFRFVDDIVIRIQGPDGAEAAHSMVDIRSKSRDGQSDLGVNAQRIRAFIEALNAAG